MKQLVLILIILIAASVTARADSPVSEPIIQIREQVEKALSKKYPAARVEITGQLIATRGTLPETAQKVSLISETGRGEATLLAVTDGGSSEIRVPYSAWAQARVAKRRIMPGESLTDASFNLQEVDLSQGQAFVYRGVILPSNEPLARTESRQSILEGQLLLQSAIQRTPDIKRGDWVRIELTSGDLKLSTTGNAAEPGFSHSTLKVVTTKTKRELAGTLRGDGVVEVKL